MGAHRPAILRTLVRTAGGRGAPRASRRVGNWLHEGPAAPIPVTPSGWPKGQRIAWLLQVKEGWPVAYEASIAWQSPPAHERERSSKLTVTKPHALWFPHPKFNFTEGS
jgi:hypothetical protein